MSNACLSSNETYLKHIFKCPLMTPLNDTEHLRIFNYYLNLQPSLILA